MRLELADSALTDLGDIWTFLARNSETQADLVIAQILECARELEATPLIGKDFSHLRRGLRRFICGQYLVFYRISGDFVEVLHVLHGKRDLEAFFS